MPKLQVINWKFNKRWGNQIYQVEVCLLTVMDPSHYHYHQLIGLLHPSLLKAPQ